MFRDHQHQHGVNNVKSAHCSRGNPGHIYYSLKMMTLLRKGDN